MQPCSYADGVENVCLAAANGEEKTTLVSDWLRDRIDGKPFKSGSVWIDSAGRPHAAAFRARKARKMSR